MIINVYSLYDNVMTRHLSQLAFFAVGEVNHVDKNGFIFSDNKNTWWGDM